MDVKSVASSAIQSAVMPDAGGAPSAVPRPPSEDAVARFHEAMSGSSGAQPEAQAAQPASETGGVERVQPEGPSTPGDAILRGLGHMNEGFDHAMQQVNDVLSKTKPGEMMNTADLMKVQMSFTQASVQQDVIGKVVGKATQNLDTFLKNQ
ncbi:type III secretion system inner rod subunit SctI [Hyphomicrobium sp. MC1]|uniref:type III secretion system inner rod subunit SctI n=1 Tax=Hyphomicrobium sp. (strain MC1) TaxID=717785 RepID=UPI000213F234|nr:type III secretion system inner rod subunit SctI [Hyphomicrobium sp. MC1]CCB66713.1 conserved protein of unknown function [Hyphomicrobium sp. MC1]